MKYNQTEVFEILRTFDNLVKFPDRYGEAILLGTIIKLIIFFITIYATVNLKEE
jgi:hypothetical protein